MEAEKSETCSRRAGDRDELTVQFQSEGLRTRKADGVNSSPSLSQKAGEDRVPAGRQAGRMEERQVERKNSFLSSHLFYSGLKQNGWGPPPLERASCFIQSDSDANFTYTHPHRYTDNNI